MPKIEPLKRPQEQEQMDVRIRFRPVASPKPGDVLIEVHRVPDDVHDRLDNGWAALQCQDDDGEWRDIPLVAE